MCETAFAPDVCIALFPRPEGLDLVDNCGKSLIFGRPLWRRFSRSGERGVLVPDFEVCSRYRTAAYTLVAKVTGESIRSANAGATLMGGKYRYALRVLDVSGPRADS